MKRGGPISITSVGSGKRRTRRHFDFDFDDASDDDGSAGHINDAEDPDGSIGVQPTSKDKSRRAALEYTKSHGKIRKAAANPDGDVTDLQDLLARGREKWGRGHNNYSDLVESPSPGSGRTALMMAAWRGHISNVALLLTKVQRLIATET